MNEIIRKRTIKDCAGCQKVTTITWNQTYRGIVNDDFIDMLQKNEEARIKKSIMEFDEKDDNTIILEINNEIVGFVKYGKSDNLKYPNTGEIFALYLLKEYQGKGYGKKLVKAAIQELLNSGFETMIIGCLAKNPSNEFYKHLGGILTSTRVFKKTGQDLIENIYYFKNIKNI